MFMNENHKRRLVPQVAVFQLAVGIRSCSDSANLDIVAEPRPGNTRILYENQQYDDETSSFKS